MKLEQKHLIPYLLYKLKIQGQTNGEIAELSEVNENNVNIKDRGFQYGWWADIFDIKPILRPLSDLDNQLFYMNLSLDLLPNSIVSLERMVINRLKTNTLYYTDYKVLVKHHFDIFNLIPQRLAVNINTLTEDHKIIH